MKIHILILLTALCCVSMGCSKRAYIKTTPHGAKATLDDGRELGETPIMLTSDVWVWTSQTITLSKEGYKPTQIELEGKPQLANIALCAVGACMLWMMWPLCIAGKYRNSNFSTTLKPLEDFDGTYDEFGSPGHLDSSSPTISFEPKPRPSAR